MIPHRLLKFLLIGLAATWLISQPARATSYVTIVLDDSGSMGQTMRTGPGKIRKIDAAKSALLIVLQQLPADTQVGILALNSRGPRGQDWVVPLGPLDRQQSRQAVSQIQASGGTPLGVAMKLAADALLEMRERKVYGEYRLLIVSDGEANDPELVEQYLPDITRRGLVVDVIGVAMQQRHSLATRVDRYRRADDRASLEQAIRESLAETSYDSQQDTDVAADFALLDAIPDEIATAVIQALTSRDNQPVGQAAPIAVAAPLATNSPGPAPEPPDQAPEEEPSSNRLPLMIAIFAFFLVFRAVMRGLRQRRR